MSYNPRYNHNLNRKSHIKKGQPSKLEGRNGDYLITQLSKGLSLCFKINDEWKELGHFRDINSKENKLSLDELKIGYTTINIILE